MKSSFSLIILILGLVLAPTASAQTLTVQQLLDQVIRLQTQIQLRQQQAGPVPASSGIYLQRVNEWGNAQPNVLKPGRLVWTYGSGFKPVMKVIIHGQDADGRAYTAVLTAYSATGTSLAFILPTTAPLGLLDIHLADGTTPISRVSNTLLVEAR